MPLSIRACLWQCACSFASCKCNGWRVFFGRPGSRPACARIFLAETERTRGNRARERCAGRTIRALAWLCCATGSAAVPPLSAVLLRDTQGGFSGPPRQKSEISHSRRTPCVGFERGLHTACMCGHRAPVAVPPRAPALAPEPMRASCARRPRATHTHTHTHTRVRVHARRGRNCRFRRPSSQTDRSDTSHAVTLAPYDHPRHRRRCRRHRRRPRR